MAAIKERRSYPVKWEVREIEGKPVIEGYAAVFDSPSIDLGGFTEVIHRGAFAESLANPANDVVALINHDENILLGRLSAGTMTLREDEVGLFATIHPPSWASGYVESIVRGDYGGMSIGFFNAVERWEGNVRHVTGCTLFDSSVVVWPAYQNTSVAARSWEQHKRNLNANKLRQLDLLIAEEI